MVNLGGYFYFSAEDVEHIETRNVSNGEHPYLLCVHFKSGKSVSVSYSKATDRDRERDVMVRRIEFELRNEMEKLSNKFYRLQAVVDKIDGRQLRIWRQLKALLNLPTDSDGSNEQ